MRDRLFVPGPHPRARSLNGARQVDEELVRAVRSLPHDPRVDALLSLWSRAVEHGRMWAIVGALGAAMSRGNEKRWTAGAAAVLASELAAQDIKRRMRRSRPRLQGLRPLAATPSRYSFPSAHTATTAAAAQVYGPLTSDRAWLAALLAMGFSRIYLGVHYPSDVLAGALIGTLVGRAARVS